MRMRLLLGMLVLLGVAACVLALFLTTQRADAGFSAAVPQSGSSKLAPFPAGHSETYEGMLTDTHCGAQHSAAVGMNPANCTRVCVHSGEHFALVDGDKTYSLEGQEAALKRLAGERIRIVGALNGNTISVASIAAPKS